VAIARNPADADEINWQQVINDIDAGITEDFMLEFDGGSNWFSTLYYTLLYQWSQMNYFVHGMADQSGRKYQEWMATSGRQRHPDLPGGRVPDPDAGHAVPAGRDAGGAGGRRRGALR
jgi:hypothetical protein